MGIANPEIIFRLLSQALTGTAPLAELYYREALRVDPRNPDLLERAFAAALSNGDEASASSLWRAAPWARP